MIAQACVNFVRGGHEVDACSDESNGDPYRKHVVPDALVIVSTDVLKTLTVVPIDAMVVPSTLGAAHMTDKFRATIVVAALFSFSSTMSAQYAGLNVGVRARVQTVAHPRWSYGRVISYDTTGILLEPCIACEGEDIPRAHILRLQASAGRTGRSYGVEGFLIGAVAGAVVGHAIVQRTGGWPGHNEMFSCVRSCAATAAAVEGALLGGLVGFTTGAFFRRERWDSVYLYNR